MTEKQGMEVLRGVTGTVKSIQSGWKEVKMNHFEATREGRYLNEKEEQYHESVENIRQKRINAGLSQDSLARFCGISRGYLSGIENHKKKVPERMLQRLNLTLEQKMYGEPLEIIIDYCRIRIPSMDLKMVLEELLRIKMEHFFYEDYAFYGYAGQYIVGNVTVMVSPKQENGILVELKGQGCRQFERYLKAQGRDWFEFFRKVMEKKGVFKRVDIAVNDKYGMLNIPHLIEKCQKGEYGSKFDKYKVDQSGELMGRREEKGGEMGTTLYLGSMKSDIYFCIYEKDYEQYLKKGIPLADAEVKNRFELRLKNDRAKLAVEDLVSGTDIGKTVFGIINNYVWFLKKGIGDKRNWSYEKEWLAFIGNEDRKLKLTIKPEPYSIERTKKWYAHQVAPSQKMLLELDAAQGTNFVESILEHTKLKEKHRKLIVQQRIPIEDLIL